MSNNENTDNGVNGPSTDGEGPSSGRCPVEEQHRPGRHHATAEKRTRTRWERNDNLNVMECYFRSNPDQRGYRKRMYEIWQEKGLFSVSEQRLADQANQIIKKGWLTKVELEELQRRLNSQSELEINPDDVDEYSVVEESNGMDGEVEQSNDESDVNVETPLDDNELLEVTKPLTPEEEKMLVRLKQILCEDRKKIPSLRNVDRLILRRKVATVDSLFSKLKVLDLTKLNDIFYAGGVLTAELLGVKQRKSGSDEPKWKKRLQGQIKELNKDADRVKMFIGNRLLKKKHLDSLQRKYKIGTRNADVVYEEIQQRVKAKTGKLKRYTNRINQFQQNRMFKNNEGLFYNQLDQSNIDRENVIPDPDDSKRFWESIWSVPQEYTKDAEWLKDVQSELEGIDEQQNIKITPEDLKRRFKQMPNWKAPGPDGVQGFWLKNLPGLHGQLVVFLNICLEKGNVPLWMTKGRTVLIQKDPNKGIIPSNYRPITCLPLMWKLLTGIIADYMYNSLESRQLLPEEQKGCRRASRGTHDLIFIDKMVLREAKRRSKNLAMAWVDYKKAYDMVPHSWIEECLSMFKIAPNIQTFLNNCMNTWRVELTCNQHSLGEVKIQRGIFQGDSLSPLLFVISLIPLSMVLRKCQDGFEFTKSKAKLNHLLYMDDLKLYAKNENSLTSLVQTVRIFSSDIGMEFGVDKCAVLILKRGKKTLSDGIDLPHGKQIKSLNTNDSYKYLGVLEADTIKYDEMKKDVRKEYFRRVRKVLETKLNGGNIIKAINTWAVSLVRYTAPFIEWSKNELRDMDRRTRKLMTMHKALHPKDDIDRLYTERKEGGRGLFNIEECVELALLGLMNYVKSSKERIISAVRESNNGVEETVKEVKKTRKKLWKERWVNKPLHGQFLRKTVDEADASSWNWVMRGHLKRETETLIMAAQDQALRTNAIKARIDKTTENSLCRMCHAKDETVMHILCECPKLAQKEYKRRHDWVGKAIHWEMSKQRGFEVKDKWYEHDPQPVIENNQFKVLWDFNVQTDHVIEARRPDMIVIDKEKKTCKIIDFAVPADYRLCQKEREKIEKYQDLKRELQTLWDLKVSIVPIVIGALGTIPKTLKQRLKELGVNIKPDQFQTSALLNSARILRKVLEI